MEIDNAQKMGSISLVEAEIWPFGGGWGTVHNNQHKTAKIQANRALPRPVPSRMRADWIDGDG
jgi:hypothetical protein